MYEIKVASGYFKISTHKYFFYLLSTEFITRLWSERFAGFKEQLEKLTEE